MILRWRPAAALVAFLLWLPLMASAGNLPIEGYGEWKLGMAFSEAKSAKPSAEDCGLADTICLNYFDYGSDGTVIYVAAVFGASQSVERISVSLVLENSKDHCNTMFKQQIKDHVAKHGEAKSIRGDVAVWKSQAASLSMQNNCMAFDPGVVVILYERAPPN